MKKDYIHPEATLFRLHFLESYMQTMSLPKKDDEIIEDPDEILINLRHEDEFEKGLW